MNYYVEYCDSIYVIFLLLIVCLRHSIAEFQDDGIIHSKHVQYQSKRTFKKLECALSCRNGANCSKWKCRGCEWNCGGMCTYSSHKNCSLKCNQNTCDQKRCKGCLMCLAKLRKEGEICPIATFKDVTKYKFSSAPYYWQKWTHSGRPYLHHGAPVFVDLNGDGVMDFFASMHGHNYELGLSSKTYGGSINPITKRIVLTDTTENSDFFIDSAVSSRIPSFVFHD